MDRIAAHPLPDAYEVTRGLWAACHGGQGEAAAWFLERGADVNWVGYDRLTPLDAARRSGAEELVVWLRQRGGKGTDDLG